MLFYLIFFTTQVLSADTYFKLKLNVEEGNIFAKTYMVMLYVLFEEKEHEIFLYEIDGVYRTGDVLLQRDSKIIPYPPGKFIPIKFSEKEEEFFVQQHEYDIYKNYYIAVVIKNTNTFYLYDIGFTAVEFDIVHFQFFNYINIFNIEIIN